MRGNVVDLAVAVVIGAAFTNIVNSVVKGIINPLVGTIGTKNLDGYYSCLKGPCTGTGNSAEGVRILWGSVLGATLTFLITAAVVYFMMVLPMSKYLARMEARRKAKEGTHEIIEVTELEVLKEIRDALVAQRGSGHDGRERAGPCASLRGGGAASRRGSASGRPRCRCRCSAGRPSLGRCRPGTAGPADRRRPARAWARRAGGRGRCSPVQGTAAVPTARMPQIPRPGSS